MSNYEKCLNRINTATEIEVKMYVGHVITEGQYKLHINRNGTVLFGGYQVELSVEDGSKLYKSVEERIEYLAGNMRKEILNKL